MSTYLKEKMHQDFKNIATDKLKLDAVIKSQKSEIIMLDEEINILIYNIRDLTEKVEEKERTIEMLQKIRKTNFLVESILAGLLVTVGFMFARLWL